MVRTLSRPKATRDANSTNAPLADRSDWDQDD
jgi:hypothetical protein